MIVTFDDAPGPPEPDGMWCFCVREEEQEEDVLYSGDDGEDEYVLETTTFRFGLIIAPTHPTSGEYRRLGYFSLGGPEPLEIWEDAKTTNEHLWPCEEYDEVEGLHTFSIL